MQNKDFAGFKYIFLFFVYLQIIEMERNWNEINQKNSLESE